MLVQKKDYAEKILDSYELEREIEALSEPVLPEGVGVHQKQTLSIL